MKHQTENVSLNCMGCDFVVHVPADQRIRVLQLTDMQVIDASQQRYDGRLDVRETTCWAPENDKIQCYDHIRSLVAQTSPDLVIMTGDIVYGEFDDTGRTLLSFRQFMDSLRIPWAPVFGNHDNESRKGVRWQCDRLEEGTYCLFRRGVVHGNSNYTVGIAQDGQLVRVLYMMDSNSCGHTDDPEVYRYIGFHQDQVEWLLQNSERINRQHPVPGFLAFHLPTAEFAQAAKEKGYQTAAHDTVREDTYVIGVDFPARDGDFGCKREAYSLCQTPDGFRDTLVQSHIDGVFVGHCHAINTSILWQGIRWTFGLKTGQYDYHIPGQLGGTLITLNPKADPNAPADNSENAPFTVHHIPALTLYAPFPKGE